MAAVDPHLLPPMPRSPARWQKMRTHIAWDTDPGAKTLCRCIKSGTSTNTKSQTSIIRRSTRCLIHVHRINTCMETTSRLQRVRPGDWGHLGDGNAFSGCFQAHRTAHHIQTTVLLALYMSCRSDRVCGCHSALSDLPSDNIIAYLRNDRHPTTVQATLGPLLLRW